MQLDGYNAIEKILYQIEESLIEVQVEQESTMGFGRSNHVNDG